MFDKGKYHHRRAIEQAASDLATQLCKSVTTSSSLLTSHSSPGAVAGQEQNRSPKFDSLTWEENVFGYDLLWCEKRKDEGDGGS